MTLWKSALLTGVLVSGNLPAPLLAAAGGADTPARELPADWQAQASGPIELKLRRLPDAVEVVIANVGAAPQLQQTNRGNAWLGLLQLASPSTLRLGNQRVGLPEAGLQSVGIEGSGSTYRLEVVPSGGAPLGRPVVSADGRNLILTFNAPAQASLQTGMVNTNTPGRLPEPALIPQLRPRAVAPPVGDMAVGTMLLRNLSTVKVSGPPVTMTLRNAPARDVLMSLSLLGNYGFVYVDEPSPAVGATPAGGAATGARPVSIVFRNESYERALNSVLVAAGLQGKREGNTIYAGPKVLSKSFGSRLSKVYRLNQVSANAAADYLANLGAQVTKTNTITTAITEGTSATNAVVGAPNSSTTQSSTTTTVEAYGATTGPLLGLQATTDPRLQAITLVGDPSVVGIAEQYLKQLDLRRRQVALSVKILDVTLDNDTQIENSFAFRYGNNFIVNDNGRLIGAFGNLLPPRGDQFDVLSGGAQAAKPTIERLTTTTTTDPTTGAVISQTVLPTERIVFPPAPAPVNPGVAYNPSNQFFDLVRATIISSSTKVLASPTLILSDNTETLRTGDDRSLFSQGLGTGAAGAGVSGGGAGGNSATVGRTRANEAFVTVGEQIITNYAVQAGQNGAPNTCQPTFGIAGLTFGARVSKIDDNGFVTFSISPTITAKVDSQNVPNCGPIDILAIRSLDSGGARVRDGQTLIMTGVISDLDSQSVQKWPILGDLPLIGQFFRGSNGSRRKRELVILVSPRIINDVEGGNYGYGYQPSTPDARQLLGGGA
ncbi:MAG: secretin N-terminal domain-containing protein [Synechococcaceae cyanobacterium]|nr:secretin N-terminal domain-containing protein [Synechococcaceae cyanobacterium]